MSQSEIDETVPGRPFEFAVYSVVRLAHDVFHADGSMPHGSTGFIIGKSADGSRYRVEFETPFHAVRMVAASDLVAASDIWSHGNACPHWR
jgi:hypothetical protein